MAADAAPAIHEHHDTLLTQHLRSFLGDIEPAAMALLPVACFIGLRRVWWIRRQLEPTVSKLWK